MLRSCLALSFASMLIAFAACDSSDSTPTADLGGDLLVQDVADARETMDNAGYDQAQTDHGTTDNGTTDNVGTDTAVQDTATTDNAVQDTATTDNVGTDTAIEDTATTDNVGTDTAVQDTTPEAMEACSGACASPESTVCAADGTTICYCNPETSAWEPYVCADICSQNYAVGDQCVLGEDGAATCGCTYDCAQATLVTGQCEDMAYTPCTCAAANPCGWQGDGYCDAACAQYFPEDHFDDTADCSCTGTCDPESFASFCDGDGNPCNCGEDGNKATEDCTAYCAGMGAVPDPEGACDASWGVAMCVCANYTCNDSAKVTAQCTNGVYTPCTCGVADPCTWATDTEYCDTPACNQLFPDQANFDDSATAPCQE